MTIPNPGASLIKSPGVAEVTSRNRPSRSTLLDGAINDGARFMFNLATTGFCWPGGDPASWPSTQPAATDFAPVYSLVNTDYVNHGDGRVLVPTTSVIPFSGGGFDMTNATLQSGVQAPAGVLADLNTPYGGAKQQFMIWGIFKMPAAAYWNLAASLETVMGELAYNADVPSLLAVSMRNNSGVPGRIDLRRQIAANTHDSANVCNVDLTSSGIGGASSFGNVAVICASRTSTETILHFISAAQDTVDAKAAGADNTQDFTALRPIWGRPNAFTNNNAVNSRFNGMKVYGGGIENLARTGRDPRAFARALWAKVAAWKAANPTIFV